MENWTTVYSWQAIMRGTNNKASGIVRYGHL